MKKLLLFLSVAFCTAFAANAQLTGMSPGLGVPGQTLQTTITSNGLFITMGSPSGNIYSVNLKNGPNVIELFNLDTWGGWPSVNIIDPNTATVDFTLSTGAVPGVYNLHVVTGDPWFPWSNQVLDTLAAAFTIASPDGDITGKLYEDLNDNGVYDTGEPGLSGKPVHVEPYNFNVNTNSTGDYTFSLPNGIYSISPGAMNNPYMFLTSADTLSATINNNNSTNNNFGFRHALQSITPATGAVGVSTVHTIVSEKPIFLPGAQANGNVSSIRFYTSPIFDVNAIGNVTVIDSFTIEVNVTVPNNVTIGNNYDLRVQLNSGYTGYHYLYQEFNVGPPDGYITGNVYHDLNMNGIKDTGEPGLQQRTVKLLPGNVTVTTNVSGDYSFGASNGTYSITILPYSNDMMYPTTSDTLSATVNNNTTSGHDFGLKGALLSITPSTGYQGITTTHQIVSSLPIFSGAGSGNLTGYVYAYTNPTTFISISNVTVINPTTIQVVIPLAMGVQAGNNFDLRLQVTGAHSGVHYLRGQFDVEPPPSLISGRLFFDSDQDKVNDPGEPGIRWGKVELTPDNHIAFSNSNGNFVVPSLGGIQTLTQGVTDPGLVLFSDSTSYTFNAIGNITGKDFGFISSNPDYSFTLTNMYLLPRCNTIQQWSISMMNSGNVAFDAVIWFNFDPNMSFVSSPLPHTVSNDTIYFQITSLQPYTWTSVHAYFTIPGIGNTLNLSVGAYALDGSGAPVFPVAYNTTKTVICAFDPNDKSVIPEGILAENFTLIGDTLEYLIRFQNTGNDTAFNVVVLDTLDNDLDYSSFEVLGSSHSVQTQLKNNGALRFAFDNIMLVDSVANEPESHGYVRYRVRAKTGLPDSTEIFNTAYIYFDLNTPIVTNTTLNTLVFVLPTGMPDDGIKSSVLIYPNPFSNSATIKFENPTGDTYTLTVMDVTGKKVMKEISGSGNSIEIERNSLSPGIYFFTLINNQTNSITSGKIIAE